MSDETDVVGPAHVEPPKKKSNRGRPKKGAKVEEVVPLHTFEGTKQDKLQKLYDQWYDCQRCPLFKERPGPDIVFARGNPDAPIMIVGEAPGEEEEATGIPFAGASGKLLNQMLAQLAAEENIRDLSQWYKKATRTPQNMERFHEEVFAWRAEKFFISNVVACRPPDNRSPVPPEIKPCWERLYNIISIVDPKLIISMGKTAFQTLTKSKKGVTDSRGELFDITLKGRVGPVVYPVLATFHPAYLLRKADWGVKGGDFRKTMSDLYSGLRIVDAIMEKSLGIPMPHREEPEE